MYILFLGNAKTVVTDGKELQVNFKSSIERDLLCLTLDGLRRAARLCCDLGTDFFVSLNVT